MDSEKKVILWIIEAIAITVFLAATLYVWGVMENFKKENLKLEIKVREFLLMMIINQLT